MVSYVMDSMGFAWRLDVLELEFFLGDLKKTDFWNFFNRNLCMLYNSKLFILWFGTLNSSYYQNSQVTSEKLCDFENHAEVHRKLSILTPLNYILMFLWRLIHG
ncbi:hypothetical protein CEXT_230381 [Caerostris extrusa]|uniref:Uncharacterized protein n=1 Tax=Caerostris extrusa TaxID=172846 RepID=A0AAV4U9L1_CAEEX|nr:hypothetical protein CEXT_230381 [Caerostris extrusa]